MERYSAARNELQKSTVRTERRAGLARVVKDTRVAGWIGTLKKLETFSDGKASISIRLEDSVVSVRTNIGNPFDTGSSTLIEHGSALYNRLASLSVGDRVIFNGSFLPGDQDHFKETSLTEAGSMTEPEFVMRFSEVAPAPTVSSFTPNVSQPASVARTDIVPESVLPPSTLVNPSPAAESITAASPTPGPPPSARSTVTGFYTWYLGEIRHGTSPWLSGELSRRAEISHGFAVRLENAKEPEPGNDPIFVADTVPGTVDVTTDKVNGFDATVAVRFGFGPDTRFVNVRLVRSDEGEPWQIDDVQPVLVGMTAQTLVPASTPEVSLPEKIRMAENRLNDVYTQLRGRLDTRHKALLKQEEIEWIKRKDALPEGSSQRADMITSRIVELGHWGEPAPGGVNQGFPSQGGVPSSTPAGINVDLPAEGSWRWVLYKNEKIPYQIPLPSYWHLLRQPLDPNANAAWIGPKGMVLSVYWFDTDEEDDFWDTLKKSAHVNQMREEHLASSPDQGGAIIRWYQTLERITNGVALQFVATIQMDKRARKMMAMSVRTPAGQTRNQVEAVVHDFGRILGVMQWAVHGGKVDQAKWFAAKDDPMLVELSKQVRPQPPSASPIDAPVPLTKAQWKDKMGRNFRWFPGTPVIGAAGQFQQVMGKPDRTQTVGDQAYWYYQCSDGTIQLVMNVLNLQMAGLIQADVNDF